MGRNANSRKQQDGAGVQALAAALTAQQISDPQPEIDAAQELDMLLAVPSGAQVLRSAAPTVQ